MKLGTAAARLRIARAAARVVARKLGREVPRISIRVMGDSGTMRGGRVYLSPRIMRDRPWAVVAVAAHETAHALRMWQRAAPFAVTLAALGCAILRDRLSLWPWADVGVLAAWFAGMSITLHEAEHDAHAVAADAGFRAATVRSLMQGYAVPFWVSLTGYPSSRSCLRRLNRRRGAR